MLEECCRETDCDKLVCADRRIPSYGQTAFIGGRYDGDRVIVYFDAVKLGNTLQANSTPMQPAVVAGFFDPVLVSTEYSKRFQNDKAAEKFDIGKKYRVVWGNGNSGVIKITSLVACQTDEFVGNDSYIGAVGTFEGGDGAELSGDHYVVEPVTANPANGGKAGLVNEPAPFELQQRIAVLMQRLSPEKAAAAIRAQLRPKSLAFDVQPFKLTDGQLRYYARAQWNAPGAPDGKRTFALGAWISPSPEMRVLAVEPQKTYYGFQDALPKLLNVAGLPSGDTMVIMYNPWEDTTEVVLAVYRDRAELMQMRRLQRISWGE